MKNTHRILQTLLFACLAGTAGAAPPDVTDAQIRSWLATRVDVQKRATGAVVGIVGPHGRRLVAYGVASVGGAPVDDYTVFDIGSITKVFTALLLSDLAARRQVALDDPLARYLPPKQTKLRTAAKAITLADLATHTSGLPLRPANLTSKDPADPYAEYTKERLYQFLSAFEPSSVPGSRYEYSNVGYGALGLALSERTGRDYATLVRGRITQPLDMHDTALAFTPTMQSHRAAGYDRDLQPLPPWNMGVLEPAGGLHSTANDLMNLLEAFVGRRASPLGDAPAALLKTRRNGGMPPSDAIALAWNVVRVDGHDVAWKNGNVGGFRSFAGYDAQAGIGVVALANAQTAKGVDDIGLHLLGVAMPVDLETPKVHVAIALKAEVLERYVGYYRYSGPDDLTVTRDGDRLFGQVGNYRFELFPESERTFFLKEVEAQVTFETGDDGRAIAAVWHEDGQDQRGPRAER